MRVLVLGGGGFIGRHIVRRLSAANHNVSAFSRHSAGSELPVILGDRDRLEESAAAFHDLRPDMVVDTLAFTESQACGLVNAFRGIAKRAVALSSGDVYRAYDILHRRVERPLDPTPLTEQSPLRERLFPYRGVPVPAVDFNTDKYDKILVERAVQADPDLPATILRLPMVYGPGAYESHKRRFRPYAKAMWEGQRTILLDQRTAQWRAPWGYVSDIAEAVRLAAENDKAAGQIYNVCEKDAPNLRGWIDELGEVISWRGRIVVADQPDSPFNLPRDLNLDQNLDMSAEKIREELGYCETVSRREAVAITVQWEQQHPPR